MRTVLAVILEEDYIAELLDVKNAFLHGINIIRKTNKLLMDQRLYLEKVLNHFHMNNCKPVSTGSTVAETEETDKNESFPYRELVVTTGTNVSKLWKDGFEACAPIHRRYSRLWSLFPQRSWRLPVVQMQTFLTSLIENLHQAMYLKSLGIRYIGLPENEIVYPCHQLKQNSLHGQCNN
ncbi:hypothetical protein HHI36_024388 [Cryptolaemus montrouzieri]|uniref:Reverse transcriptase Ty1/copia-type domain-containing protein n=1 Tax=Cryptolaemus montrouzieri TaxID=559131 RepID=A0ABD2MW53_9CUCU